MLLAPFLGLLVAIAVIDWRHRIIPNGLDLPRLLIAAGYLVVARLAGAPVDLVDAVIGFLAYGGGLLLDRPHRSPKGMGMGDVKLAALVGLVLGALGLRYVAVAAGLGILIGGVAAVVALVAGRSRKSGLPVRAVPGRSGPRSPPSPRRRSRTRTSALTGALSPTEPRRAESARRAALLSL